MIRKSDFGKAVADEFRTIREIVRSRPEKDSSVPEAVGSIDRSVKEQVISDIDHIIERHENRKGG